MTTVFAIFILMLAQAPPTSLDQIRTDPNLEHRARLAIDFAATAERNAEAAYSKGEMAAVTTELKTMEAAIGLADEALKETGKSAMRHPAPYKYGELKTQEILSRLKDLDHRMEPDERPALEGPRTKVQEIHDAWFDGIMSKRR
jgi:hypothetical protein